MRSLAIMVATVIALCVAGCAVEAPAEPLEPRPATIAELTGPWHPAPFLLDRATWSRIEQGCLRDLGVAGAGRAAVIDVRGGGVASVFLDGPRTGACHALEIAMTGEIIGAGSGKSDWPPVPQPAPGKLGAIEHATVEGGELKVQGWLVSGRAGPGIATVTIDLPGCPITIASLANGWFSSWCQVPGQATGQLHMGPAPRAVVRGLDAFGNMLDTTTN